MLNEFLEKVCIAALTFFPLIFIPAQSLVQKPPLRFNDICINTFHRIYKVLRMIYCQVRVMGTSNSLDYFLVLNSSSSNKNWIYVSSSPRSYTGSALVIHLVIFQFHRNACAKNKKKLMTLANYVDDSKLGTHNSCAWTTPQNWLPNHFSTYSTNFIGFPTLLSQYAFSLESSHSKIAMSVGECAEVDIRLWKYFCSPICNLSYCIRSY
jgi:hypothetical protein